MFERICVIVEHSADFIHIGNAVVILGAVVDVVYALLDPRIRL